MPPPTGEWRGKLAVALRFAAWTLIAVAGVIAAILLTVFGVGSLIPGFVVGGGLFGLVVFRRRLAWYFGGAVALCLFVIGWRSNLTPRNDRDWKEELAVLPRVSVEEDTVTVEGVRHFDRRADGRSIPNWETRTYRLRQLEGVDMILEPFEESDLMAHTMLTFDFGADGWLLLTIEARMSRGEEYNAILGGLNQYELIYVFADERDALISRADQGHELYAFPIKADSLKLRAFFLSLCATANNLHVQPRFYHIIRDNCTTAWIHHSDHLAARPVGLRLESVLNGRIARLLHRNGVIETRLSYSEAKESFRIDDDVLRYREADDFSEAIRRGGRSKGGRNDS